MKLVRRLAAVAGALALGSGVVMTGGAAHAATPTPTITFKVEDFSNPTHPRYGDYVDVSADVDISDPAYFVEGGSLVIQAAPVGSSAWTTVDTGTTFASYSIDGIKAPTQFRAVFTNGTGSYDNGTDFVDVTFPSASASGAIGSLDRGDALAKQTKHKVCYQVGPAPYKNKPIKYYEKLGKSKKWKYAGTTRTNKKSQYCYKISHKKVKSPKTKYKGPKLKAFKTVYVKSGGMKKSVIVDTF